MNTVTYHQFNSPFNRFFGEAQAGCAPGYTTRSRAGVYKPGVEIQKSDKAYRVIANLPGVTKENLTIEVNNGILNISGVYTKAAGSDEFKTIHSEFGNRKEFKRSLRLDKSQVDTEQVDARLENGVLVVSLPIKEAVKPRKVDIN